MGHRMFVLLRGTPQRLRSRYRLRAFADMLRGLRIAVGYRLTAARVSMELSGVDIVQPIFAKVLAPAATRPEAWSDLALEIRALGLDTRTTIVGAIETRYQLDCAVAGFELGQDARCARLSATAAAGQELSLAAVRRPENQPMFGRYAPKKRPCHGQHGISSN
jgi:hypothetical protein